MVREIETRAEGYYDRWGQKGKERGEEMLVMIGEL